MKHPLMPNIIKLSAIMRQSEEFIKTLEHCLLPNDKELLIDLCLISLSRHIDDLFTYTALKNIVADLVAKHEQQQPRWFIDVDRCTSTDVVVVDEISNRPIRIPIQAFLMSTPPLNLDI